MKTQQEILARYKERTHADIFGFECTEYLCALDFEHARPYLKDDVTEWEPSLDTDEKIRARAIDYMSFAWGKAIDCRGISAERSLAHYVAWLWMLGDGELWPTLENYEYYGKDELRAVCEWLGIDADEWDDGIRVNSE